MEGGWGSSVGNLWKVPENDYIKIKEEPEGWKLGQREASVLRYKEKRQNRLFSKKIRYQVRKLNAEKRPRMKVLVFVIFQSLFRIIITLLTKFYNKT